MAGKGPEVIGVVAIKVMPDLKQFRRDTAKHLERIERQLKLEIDAVVDDERLQRSARRAVAAVNLKSARGQRDFVVKIKAVLDDKGVLKTVRETVRDAERALNARPLDVDTRKAERSVEELGDSAVRTSMRIRESVHGAFDAMNDDIREAANRADRELREMAKQRRIEFIASLDEDRLRMTRDELDDLVRKYNGKNLNFQPSLTATAHRWVQARLAWLGRTRFVSFAPVVDTVAYQKAAKALAALSGARLLSSTMSNFYDLFKNLDKNIPLVGTIVEAIMGLSAWLLAAASNTFALSRSLAQIGGVALTLPGIVAGLAIGIGSTVAVLRDFNAMLPTVRTELGKLQDRMSAEFWTVAREPIRELIFDLLPELTDGLRQTSRSLGVWFAGLSNALRGRLKSSLPGMFDDLAKSIAIANTGNEAFAKSIEILGRTGAGYLPRLANWFARINESFADWLERSEESGRLNEIIDLGIYQLGQLNRALRHTGGFLTGIARAAEKAGGSTLTMFADTMERLHAAVDTESFQTKLITVLTAAHGAMNDIATISGPRWKAFWSEFSTTLSRGFNEAGKAIGELLGAVSAGLNTESFHDGFVAFLAGLRTAIDQLSPGLVALGEGLGSVMRIAGSLADAFAPLLNELLVRLAGSLARLEPAIIKTVDALSGQLLDIIVTLAPPVLTFAEAVADALLAVLRFEPVVLALAAALTAVKVAATGQALANAVASLTTLSGLSGKLGRASSAIGAIGTKLGTIGLAVGGAALLVDWAGHLGVVTPDVNELADAIDRLAGAVGRAEIAKMREEINRLLAGDQGIAGALGANQIDGLRDAVQEVLELEGEIGHRTGISNFFRNLSPAAHQARVSTEAFDAALAEAVRTNNVGELTALLAMLDAELKDTSAPGAYAIELNQALSQMTEYQDALTERTEAAVQAQWRAYEAHVEQALAVQKAKDAATEYRIALEDLNGVTPSVITGINEASKGFIDLSADVGEGEFTLQGWIKTLQSQMKAQAEWADNMALLAKRGVSDGLLKELEKLGPEGAEKVAALVDATPKELRKVEKAMKRQTEGVVDTTKGEFAKLAGEVETALEPLQGTLEAAGVDAATGLITGLESKYADAYNAGSALASEVRRGAEETLDIRSPSRVMARVGRDVVAGLASGLKDGKLVRDEIVKMAESIAGLLTEPTISKLERRIDRLNIKIRKLGSDDKSRKQRDAMRKQVANLEELIFHEEERAAKAEKAAARVIRAHRRELNSTQKLVDANAKALADARDALAEAKRIFADYRDAVKDSIVREGNLVSLWAGIDVEEGGEKTVAMLRERLDEVLATAQRYTKDVQTLLDRGLDSNLVQQLVDAGLGSAAEVAHMLANASKGELEALSKTWVELEKVGSAFGKSMASEFHQHGIDVAKGLVAGLKSERASLRKAMEQLADDLVKTLKKKLKIKSPSRVMEEIGRFIMQGQTSGIRKESAKTVAAMERAAEMVEGAAFGSSTSRAMRAAAASAGQTVNSKTINYYAAPGSSLGAEEDLFAALGRARGW